MDNQALSIEWACMTASLNCIKPSIPFNTKYMTYPAMYAYQL